jgi:hypothetical protein
MEKNESLIAGLLKMKSDLKLQIETLINGIKNIDGVIALLDNNAALPRKPKNLIFQHNECKLMLLDMLRNASGSPLDIDEICQELIRIKNIDMTDLTMNSFRKGIKISLGRLVSQKTIQRDSTGKWFV